MYRNREREAEVFKYWKGGHYTIDQISTSTGIPRSTVGYYVKKFSRKYPRDHRQNVTRPSVERNKYQGFAVTMLKKVYLEAQGLFGKEQYRAVKELVDAYYALRKLESEYLRDEQEKIRKETDTMNAVRDQDIQRINDLIREEHQKRMKK